MNSAVTQPQVGSRGVQSCRRTGMRLVRTYNDHESLHVSMENLKCTLNLFKRLWLWVKNKIKAWSLDLLKQVEICIMLPQYQQTRYRRKRRVCLLRPTWCDGFTTYLPVARRMAVSALAYKTTTHWIELGVPVALSTSVCSNGTTFCSVGETN